MIPSLEMNPLTEVAVPIHDFFGPKIDEHYGAETAGWVVYSLLRHSDRTGRLDTRMSGCAKTPAQNLPQIWVSPRSPEDRQVILRGSQVGGVALEAVVQVGA